MPRNVAHKSVICFKLTARKKLLIGIIEVSYSARRSVAGNFDNLDPSSSNMRAMQDAKTFLHTREG